MTLVTRRDFAFFELALPNMAYHLLKRCVLTGI